MPENNKNTFPPIKPGMVFGFLEVIEKTDPYRLPGIRKTYTRPSHTKEKDIPNISL